MTCERCDGRGLVNCTVFWSSGVEGDAERECPDCEGTGEAPDDGDDAAEREIDRLDMIGLDPWGNEK